MPETKKNAKQDKTAKKNKPSAKAPKNNAQSPSATSTSTDVRLDVVFVGPMLFIPSTVDGNVTDVEVLTPANGHPMGAVFVPAIFYTDAEIDSPASERWPDLESFLLLDHHSYAIDVHQTKPKNGSLAQFPSASIPDSNHKIKPGRKLGNDWSIAITLRGQLSGWTSHRLQTPGRGMYQGSDAPTSGQTANAQRLTYSSIKSADFCGISQEAKEYLRANVTKGGTIIILGEIPYQATLHHEREAVASLARLAGLDLHLMQTTPTINSAHVTSHVSFCGFSVIQV